MNMLHCRNEHVPQWSRIESADVPGESFLIPSRTVFCVVNFRVIYSGRKSCAYVDPHIGRSRPRRVDTAAARLDFAGILRAVISMFIEKSPFNATPRCGPYLSES